MYCCIVAYITHLHHIHKERIEYVSAEQLPDEGIAIRHNTILLPFVHESHHDPVLHPAENESSDTEANRENWYIDPEQPWVQTRIHDTPRLEKPCSRQPQL